MSAPVPSCPHGRWPAVAIAAAASAVCIFLSTAGNGVALLAWIAPAPILAVAFGAAGAARRGEGAPGAARRIALGALAAALAGNMAWVVLYWGILPLPGLAALVLLLALAFAVVVWLSVLVAARVGAWAGVLMFPAAWAAFELAVARLSPHGSAGSLAYSQVDFAQLVQLAAWTGLAGITFVVLFVAAGLGAACGDRLGSGLRWRFIAGPALVLVTVLAAGELRLRTPPGAGRVLVGLVSIDGGMRAFETTKRDEALRVLEAYLEAAGSLTRRGAEVVVMPEKMIGVAPAYEGDVARRLSAESERSGALLVAGINRIAPEGRRNVAVMFSRGRQVLQYEKQRLVPGVEIGYRRGSQAGLHRAPGGMTGVAICKDLDFPEIGRAYGRAGIGILFVPAWDFVRDARLHSRMAVMRGIEGGYSVARAAADGLLTGSDSLGQVLGERPSDAESRSTLLVALPLGPGRTFYSEHGDWFGWAAAALGAALILLAARYTARL